MTSTLKSWTGRALSLCAALVLATALLGLGGRAEAKTTNDTGSAWAGYGDSGYIGRPARARKHVSNKTRKVASKKRRYASIDRNAGFSAPATSATGGGVRWLASSSCLNGTLISAISQVSSIASVTVNSTCRSRGHNAAVGGAKHSHHLTGDAVDFRVHGNIGAVASLLRSNGSLGGVKHYGGGLFHIDTGPRRTW